MGEVQTVWVLFKSQVEDHTKQVSAWEVGENMRWTTTLSAFVGIMIGLLLAPLFIFPVGKKQKQEVELGEGVREYELKKIDLSIRNALGSGVEFYRLITPKAECIVLVNTRAKADMMAMDLRCF